MTLGITNLVYAPQLPGWQDGQVPASITSAPDYARIMTQFLDAVGMAPSISSGIRSAAGSRCIWRWNVQRVYPNSS